MDGLKAIHRSSLQWSIFINNLAIYYDEFSQHQEAIQLYGRTIEVQKRILVAEHFHTNSFYEQSGHVLRQNWSGSRIDAAS